MVRSTRLACLFWSICAVRAQTTIWTIPPAEVGGGFALGSRPAGDASPPPPVFPDNADRIARPAPAGLPPVVSARSMARPPVPKKASQAFREAVKASEAGDRQRAMAKLREAIRLHPPFTEARTNLGAQLARLGRYEEALAELEEAKRLDDASALVWTNSAAVYLEVGRLIDGEMALRRALRLQPGYAPAHYLMGNLATRRRDYGEARRQLLIAAETMPAARRALERLMNSGLVRSDP